MAELGTVTLHLALVLALYAGAGSVAGKLRSSSSLLLSVRRATYLLPVVLAVATLSLVAAFVRHDFRVEYVARHSSLAMDPIYTWVALYAGNEGSLLFIAFAFSLLSAAALALASRSLAGSLPYTNAILAGVSAFVLGVTAFLANPFQTLPVAPPDGQGINPLLTHPGMFVHPPLLMIGLIGVSVPYAIAVGALLTGDRSDAWVDQARTWSLVVWAILGSGLLLGAWWAYTILGWGGYWGWDPIENVALMPWLVLTGFVHTVMVQKRRGMFGLWNLVLIAIAFTLALFGIFINRGGPVPSVHSFGASTLGWVFLAFLAFSVAFSLVVLLVRAPALRGTAALEFHFSREAAFLFNNLLLLGVALVTLWGVVYPLVSQMVRGVAVTVGAPFYNQVNGPLFLALVFLMGVGPLLPWRHASWAVVRRAIQVPGLAAVLAASLLALVGVRQPVALFAFGLCAFVVAGVLQEWARGTWVRHRRGQNLVAAFASLVGANRPRYGGYIVHLAIVMVALGVIGSSFYGTQRDVVLAAGEQVSVGGYTVIYRGTRVETHPDRTEFFHHLQGMKGQRDLGPLVAWRAFYPDRRMASTRAAIRSTPVEDLYVVSTESLEDGRVVFRVMVKPLVWWIWMAGPVMILGTLVSLWPQRRPLVESAAGAKRAAVSAVPVE
ncbi:MAG: heme lyase CcmF/NrfE family subunit [Chloroflexi bacterium]|nr:heme lyase CcmF/NrfE family subunit [Chloroflexota bacterium]